ncbi:transcription elongation factor S-II [Verruconis gallopava]|uniref:Transcription elongation factor n=1 Tax=Verruconis gallopava TaxID=253628 RepID=A0A0D1YFP4_9PEZI|nr:transcription elongation factor S-II [Verruconis gallopava]KIV99551.1 transcription elongation factor S-II [Verruconis gallopava]
MAMDVKAVDAKRNDLDKAIRDNAPASAVLKILNELKAGIVPSEKLLRETKIGVSVNRLRNHKDPNVQKLANETVTSWRNAMRKQQASSGSSTPKPNGTASPAAGSPANVKQEKKAYTGDPLKRNAVADKIDWKVTGSAVRDGCIKLMYDGLAHTSSEPSSDILNKAREVELAAFSKFQPETSSAYREKMRSLFQNLKNKSNPQLRINIMSGSITAEKFVVMTHDELKSAERKAEEAKLAKDNMDKAMVPQEIKSVSDALKCGKCGQKRVSYTQAQTRSADEPMTTFCECLNCGNRWKFS